MAYQSLYRKWRSQKFSELVGQNHIAKTLKNAIMQNKIAHSYLFTGARGTGKTSTARIFAKAMNCRHASDGEPCNICDICVDITLGIAADVLEIDAASNNGVDEIRDLCDNVSYVPAVAKKKVYIIDEVHMLSTGAFNALLKTLEEPPAHVTFILATTEVHKLPLTIISRCQRYDFRILTEEAIFEQMSYIMDQEKISFEKHALQIIANIAQGAMRDALSILDQVISFCDGRVTVAETLDITGGAPQQELANLTLAVAAKEVSKALQIIEKILLLGKQPSRVVEELIFFYRNLLFIQIAASREDEFYYLAEQLSFEVISDYIFTWSQTLQNIKGYTHGRIFLEITVIRLCTNKITATAVITTDQQELTDTDGSNKLAAKEILDVRTFPPEKTINSKTSALKPPQFRQNSQFKNYPYDLSAIFTILDNATKKNKEKLLNLWSDVKANCFKSEKSKRLLLNESEPVAVSESAFILKLQEEDYCVKVSNSNQFIPHLQKYLQQKTGIIYAIIIISPSDWQEERARYLAQRDNFGQSVKQEDEPIVSEANRIFGKSFVEINHNNN